MMGLIKDIDKSVVYRPSGIGLVGESTSKTIIFDMSVCCGGYWCTDRTAEHRHCQRLLSPLFAAKGT
jgi:hypothetical protein